MSYLETWARIKELNIEETQDWIDKVFPARGVTVEFFGIKCVDVDLLEKLRYWMDDLLPK